LDVWISIPWLVVAFGLMLLVHRWLEAHLQGLAYLITGHPTVAMWVFFIVFLPGTLVHELSHWLAARLLGVRTGHIVIWPQEKRNGAVWLGAVQVGRADAFRSSLIGLAPLVAGSVLSAIVGAHLRLDTLGSVLVAGEWHTAWGKLGESVGLPDFWLWIYLLFAIANRMLPSPADRHAWKPVAIFLVAASAVILASGWAPQMDTGVSTALRDVVGFLLYAFTVIVAVDIVVSALVGVLEIIVGVVRRQRVVY
jgi:hypothetical protein